MSSSATTTTTTTTTTQTHTTTQQMSKGSAHSPSTNSAASACLRLQSDLRSIRIEPPEVKDDGREKHHRSALFFFPMRTTTRGARVRYFPKTGEEEKRFYLFSRYHTHTHRFITDTRCSHVVDVAYFYHRDVRHRRTRTITCSCGRRRFADRKIRPGKAASSLFG